MCEHQVRSFAVHALVRACQREHLDKARVEAAHLICKSLMPESVGNGGGDAYLLYTAGNSLAIDEVVWGLLALLSASAQMLH